MLLVGGTSDIGRELVEAWLDAGAERLVVTTRTGAGSELAEAAAERGVAVHEVSMDVVDAASVTAGVREAWADGDIDLAVVAVGLLGDQADIEASPARSREVFEVNTVGTAHVALEIAAHLEQQGHGTLVLLSSVAGRRGRRDNYVYGASKAALDVFAEGLEQRLRPSRIRVLLVRPGYVHSRMSAGVEPAPFAVTLAESRDAILRGYARGRSVVYVPSALQVVFGVISVLPRRVWAAVVRRMR